MTISSPERSSEAPLDRPTAQATRKLARIAGVLFYLTIKGFKASSPILDDTRHDGVSAGSLTPAMVRSGS